MSKYIIQPYDLTEAQQEELKTAVAEDLWDTIDDVTVLTGGLKNSYGTAIELKSPTTTDTIVTHVGLGELFPTVFPEGANGYWALPLAEFDFTKTGRDNIKSYEDLDAHYPAMYALLSNEEWIARKDAIKAKLAKQGNTLEGMGASDSVKPTPTVTNAVGIKSWNILGTEGLGGFGFARLELDQPCILAIEEAQNRKGTRSYFKIVSFLYEGNFKVVCNSNLPAKKINKRLDQIFSGSGTVKLSTKSAPPTKVSVDTSLIN
jgi:hypothetical protein